jgi:hypothetical protein
MRTAPSPLQCRERRGQSAPAGPESQGAGPCFLRIIGCHGYADAELGWQRHLEAAGSRVAITSPEGGVLAIFDLNGAFIDMP